MPHIQVKAEQDSNSVPSMPHIQVAATQDYNSVSLPSTNVSHAQELDHSSALPLTVAAAPGFNPSAKAPPTMETGLPDCNAGTLLDSHPGVPGSNPRTLPLDNVAAAPGFNPSAKAPSTMEIGLSDFDDSGTLAHSQATKDPSILPATAARLESLISLDMLSSDYFTKLL